MANGLPRAAAALLGGACLALAAGCPPSMTDIQRDYARTLKPAEVQAVPPEGPAPPGAVRVLRVRAWADADYRAQTLRWKERILAQVDRANAVLQPQFGVRLDAGEPRVWEHRGRGDDLEAPLADLAAVDEGRGADWVVGFVSALPSFSESPHLLGMARYFGRHMVLRGMDQLAELQAIDAVFDKLPAREREQLARERRLHRETALLLHEWAHTLGAFHERSAGSIMSMSYGHRVSGFSAPSAEVIRLGLRYRDAADDPASRSEWGTAYREVLTRHAEEHWSAESREEMLARAASWFGVARGVAAARPGGGAAPPPSAAEARRACQAGSTRGAPSRQALEACRAAAESPGATPEDQVALAYALLEVKDFAGALAAARRAEAALFVEQAGPRWWSALAQLYVRADTCSAAERAAARAAEDPGAEQVLADCTRLRRGVGLPRDGRLPEVREHEYVAAMREAEAELLRRRTAQALERARRIEQAFPGSAGGPLVRCASRAQDKPKARARARADCAAAALAAPESPVPQYVLGVIAADEGRWQEARDHLRRAVRLDDGVGLAWLKLATAYRELGDAQALEALRASYQARFGMPLRLRP